MTGVTRLYLDTNILVMLGENTGPEVDLLYELIEDKASPEQPLACTSELSLSELLVQPLRDDDDNLIDLYEDWLIAGSWMTVGPVSRDTLYRAAALRAYYPAIKLPDAIHLSTAFGLSCSHFLTADKRIPKQVELASKDRGMPHDAASLEVIEPSIAVLTTLLAQRKA